MMNNANAATAGQTVDRSGKVGRLGVSHAAQSQAAARQPQLPVRKVLYDNALWIYLAILATAAATAVAFNVFLVNASGAGINLFLTAGVFASGWFFVAKHCSVPLWRKLAAIAALTYAFAVAFRASEILLTVNIVLMIGFFALACTPLKSRTLNSIWASIRGAGHVVINVLIGAIAFAVETPWERLKLRSQGAQTATRVLVGIIAAFPFLLVFGLLFSRAELRFGQYFQYAFDAIISAIFQDFWTLFLAFMVSLGLLRCAFLNPADAEEGEGQSAKLRLQIGFIESATVLSLLTAMFALFVATQLPYLFGGQQQVSSTPGLAWSEYARQGFFELAWVITLLIPTLLLFMTCASTESRSQRKVLRFLCWGLSTLAGIIIISALQRMVLYTQNFGLTELRIYVSTCIIMLGLLIVLLNALAAKEKLHLFLPAALATGFVFSMGIQVPNVQAVVARDIIQRHQAGKKGDLNYLSSLSTDAVPAIADSTLPDDEKAEMAQKILRTARAEGEFNWLYQPISAAYARRSADSAGLVE